MHELHDPCKTNQIPTWEPRRSSRQKVTNPSLCIATPPLIGHGLIPNAHPVLGDPSERQPALTGYESSQ